MNETKSLRGDSSFPKPGTGGPATARRRARGERGQAAVEFALVLPVLLLLLVGIIKGGTLYNNYIQLTDSVRTGARELAIERGQASPCGDAASEVVSSAGGLDGSRIAMTMSESPEGPGDPAGATYTTTGPPSGPGACPFTLTSGSAATLSASYSCDLNILGVDFIPGCTLSARATERVE